MDNDTLELLACQKEIRRLHQVCRSLEKQANAAPDLLEACKEAYVYLNQPTKSKYGNVEIINLLHAVITKAEAR